MEHFEARVLLKNLLHRVKRLEDGSNQIAGIITDDELSALKFAFDLVSSPQSATGKLVAPNPPQADNRSTWRRPQEEEAPLESTSPASVDEHPVSAASAVKLNLHTLELPPPPANIRFCLDFGTAMSKATLVQDGSDDTEDIRVLRLGVPGDQEEVSETLLISSVYIDNEGALWFGKAAVDRSMVEGGDGSRQRLDNIKRRLSEEGWDELVGPKANPTDIRITHGEMVLAYLTFLTWAVNRCIEPLSYPRNLPRRFAMPCLLGAKGRETIHRLRVALGEAQVLADTFDDRFNKGLKLSEFIDAARQLRSQTHNYSFIAEDITEPLGVAGSILSWKSRIDSLLMVVDIGAGTSDLSLYRLHFDPANGSNVAVEVEGSSRGLTEAGNHLDRMLIELIIKKSGVTSDDPLWVNVRSALELQIRDLKETLFNDGYLFVTLLNGIDVEIELAEFLELPPVQRFGENLREKMVDILETVDPSWVRWVTANPSRRLAVALTGGGAELPMVRSLAEGEINTHGMHVPVVRAVSFPEWLKAVDENLEDEYGRIAVSLGGARRRLIEKGNKARVTAGDITSPPKLEGYFTKGA